MLQARSIPINKKVYGDRERLLVYKSIIIDEHITSVVGFKMVTKSEIVAKLNLKPHPEGGFYTETFRDSSVILSKSHLPPQCKLLIRFVLFVLKLKHLGFLDWDLGLDYLLIVIFFSGICQKIASCFNATGIGYFQHNSISTTAYKPSCRIEVDHYCT